MEAVQRQKLPAPSQGGTLMRIEPEVLPGAEGDSFGNGITIRHGESIVTLPSGSSMEAVADLVKVLNSHA